jgi:cation:H+ antiporter
LVVLMIWLVRVANTPARDDPITDEFASEIPTGGSTASYVGWLVLGLLVLLGGAQSLVWGAVQVAHAFGVSDLVIGLTVVAVGTSLPELAASIAGARKGEPDIAIGNIIGSNLFNLLAVMGIAGAIHPATLSGEVLSRDYPVMAGMTLLLALLVYGALGHRGRITRLDGLLLVAAYSAYMVWIYLSTVA